VSSEESSIESDRGVGDEHNKNFRGTRTLCCEEDWLSQAYTTKRTLVPQINKRGGGRGWIWGTSVSSNLAAGRRKGGQLYGVGNSRTFKSPLVRRVSGLWEWCHRPCRLPSFGNWIVEEGGGKEKTILRGEVGGAREKMVESGGEACSTARGA